MKYFFNVQKYKNFQITAVFQKNHTFVADFFEMKY